MEKQRRRQRLLKKHEGLLERECDHMTFPSMGVVVLRVAVHTHDHRFWGLQTSAKHLSQSLRIFWIAH